MLDSNQNLIFKDFYLKQIYDIKNLKGNFVQLFARFISLTIPLSYRVKSSYIEINKDNINENAVIPSSIYFIIF